MSGSLNSEVGTELSPEGATLSQPRAVCSFLMTVKLS